MLDVFCLCCNCLDSCFICVMLCAFTRIYVWFFFYLLSSCVSVFAAFERDLCQSSSAYRPVYCELMHCLHAVFYLFIDVYAAFAWTFIYSSMCAPPLRELSFCIRELHTKLFVVPQTMHVCTTSSMSAPPSCKILFCVQEFDTQLFVVPQTMHVCTGVVCFGTCSWRCGRCLLIESLECCERRFFCLLSLVQAPGPLKASLVLNVARML
jgi:hypothetical protein